MGGTFDAVIQRPDGLWVLDFKTSKYLDVGWTRSDLQATIYTWAARKLYGPQVRGVIFRFLLKKVPLTYESLILKSGTVTERRGLDKSTTYVEYIKAVAVATLMDLAKNDFIFAGQVGLDEDSPKASFAALLDGTQQEKDWYPAFSTQMKITTRMFHKTLMDLRGTSNFFWEVKEHRSDLQIRKAANFVLLPAMKEMNSRRKGRWVGPTGLGASFAVCSRCMFKTPCKLLMDGADFRTCLREDFELRDIYRPKEEVNESSDG